MNASEIGDGAISLIILTWFAVFCIAAIVYLFVRKRADMGFVWIAGVGILILIALSAFVFKINVAVLSLLGLCNVTLFAVGVRRLIKVESDKLSANEQSVSARRPTEPADRADSGARTLD